MKEILELRVNKEYFHLLFEENEGKDFGSFVKLVNISMDDPRIKQIGILQQKAYKKEDAFFFGWRIMRKYTSKEIESANLFLIKIKKTFEPAGEECGTVYDAKGSCSICGANKRQVGPLKLKKSSIPKKDISRTIAGENIVSERFAVLQQRYGLKGIRLEPVFSRSELIDFYQLQSDVIVDISPKTVTGVNPFDLSGSCESKDSIIPGGFFSPGVKEVYKCPNKDTIGLNLISEVYIQNNPLLEEADFFMSKQKIGVSRGFLQPESEYLCSRKFKQMIENENLTGFAFEIAHID